MELKEGIKQINQSVTQSSASDATLEGYMLELKDANGNLVDKQPVSKIESLVYNYLTTKRKSELVATVGGNQNGNADGFVKFINTFIDDTIDDITPNGIYPLLGEEAVDRGYAFRFYSDKHTRALEIKVCEKSGMFYRTKTGPSEWAAWKSVGVNSMGVLSKSEDLNNVKSPGVYVLYTEQHPSNTPSELLPTTTSLLKVTDGEPVLIQEIYPLAGEPYYRLYYKNNFKWYDWTSLSTGIPSFYKDYSDIASLARGIRPQTIKNGASERVYKIGVIPQGYNPSCYNFWVAGTNAAKPAECTLIVGDEGTGKGLADNVVMYKDWGAGEIGVSNFVEIAVVARTVYLVCKADVSITFGEYAEEVTGVDLSSAYNVPFKKIPTFYKDYNSLSELKDALKAIW